MYIVAITSLGFFIYGLWLSNNIKSIKQAAIFSSVYFLLVSILTFFTSNILYAAGVAEGTIVESVHYFSFSLIEYLLIVAILSAVIFILSSPKVLYKEIQTTKAYVWASLLGLAIVIIAYFIMMAIMNNLFADPESVKESYEILVGSVGFGYIGFAILIILNRSKAKGVKNNE